MTDPLALLKELDAARTPGEWRAEPNTAAGRVWVQRSHDEDCEPLFAFRTHKSWWPHRGQTREEFEAEQYRRREADARFIAACSTAVPLLIEVAEAARAVHETIIDGRLAERRQRLHDALYALNNLSVADTPGKGQ
jgi:hypothetical protein